MLVKLALQMPGTHAEFGVFVATVNDGVLALNSGIGDDRQNMESRVRVDLALADADDAELDRATGALLRELRGLDVDSASRVRDGDAPRGSKAVEAAAFGAIIVKVAESSSALLSVVKAIASWTSRRPERSVRIEVDGDVLELRGASAVQQQQLIDAWLARRDRAEGATQDSG